MESKYVPGPWTAGGINVNLRVTGHRISGPSNNSVAFVVSGHGRSDATASLVAAAPDLLKACKAVDAVATQYGAVYPKGFLKALDTVRAAIEKAEGR